MTHFRTRQATHHPSSQMPRSPHHSPILRSYLSAPQRTQRKRHPVPTAAYSSHPLRTLYLAYPQEPHLTHLATRLHLSDISTDDSDSSSDDTLQTLTKHLDHTSHTHTADLSTRIHNKRSLHTVAHKYMIKQLKLSLILAGQSTLTASP
jgi:hypothetical protein